MSDFSSETILPHPKCIAIVVGESSGDILGAGLVRALKKRFPECTFEGIGGPLMQAEGFVSLFPMERLSVMGFTEPLRRLPELLSILKQLKNRFITNQPDFFVGIDAPDFNLRLEKKLKAANIFTVHYVSPSVWAWRQGRIKTIIKSVDLMLTLFPFEADFYQKHHVDVAFVGHTLADDIDLHPDQNAAKLRLGLDLEKRYVALLPGSRSSEVNRLLPIFLNAAISLHTSLPDIKYLIPAVNAERKSDVLRHLDAINIDNVEVFDRQSHDVMLASDLVIMASGTTTLEAMLLKRPMIIAYQMSAFSFAIISWLVKIPFIGLPNLLAGKKLVPEFIQNNATPENISLTALSFLTEPEKTQELCGAFLNLHQQLRKNASHNAANIIVDKWRNKMITVESENGDTK